MTTLFKKGDRVIATLGSMKGRRGTIVNDILSREQRGAWVRFDEKLPLNLRCRLEHHPSSVESHDWDAKRMAIMLLGSLTLIERPSESMINVLPNAGVW